MARISLMAVLVAALCACGGGGDDGGPPQPLTSLSGPYHYVMINRDVSADAVRAETGQVTFDDMGTVSYGMTYGVEETTVIAPHVKPDATYSIAGGRDLMIIESGGRLLEGVASADARLASAACVTDGPDPSTMFLVHRDTSPAQADLAGAWVMFHWGRVIGPGSYASAGVADVAIDPLGAWTTTNHHYNVDGAIDPFPTVSVASELVVGAGGWIIRRENALAVPGMRGGISSDHDIILLASVGGGLTTQPNVTVLVRVATSPTEATLNGSYGSAALYSQNLGGYGSMNGPFDMDGLGSGGGWTREANTEGGDWSGWQSIDYTVQPSGRVTFSLAGGDMGWGAVGPSGRFAIYSGMMQTDGFPTINFLIR